MTIRQLSVFLENKTGYLNQVLNVLARNQINIVALTVADTSDYGIMRAIVSNPEKALEALRAEQFTVRVHEILVSKWMLPRFNVAHTRSFYFSRYLYRICICFQFRKQIDACFPYRQQRKSPRGN